MEVPAPASLQPLPNLSLLPPVDTPEAAFDMIAAANFQPEATPDVVSIPEAEAEEPEAAAADPEDALTSEPEENVDEILSEEEAEEEEIPLEEVHHCHCINVSSHICTVKGPAHHSKHTGDFNYFWLIGLFVRTVWACTDRVRPDTQT